MRRLFRMLTKNKASSLRSARKARRASGGFRRGLQLESLEDRRVFAVEFGSVVGIGNGQSDSTINDVAVDSSGNRYVTGSFSGEVDFDENSVHAGNVDILLAGGAADAFVAKYAPDDSLLWVRRFGSNLNQTQATVAERGWRIDLDSAGNVYTTGYFEATAAFGSFTKSSVNGRDGYLVKLNAQGSAQWVQTWDVSATDSPQSMDVDASGNIALSTSGVDSTLTNFRKYSATGSLAWSNSIANYYPPAGGTAIDSSGSVYFVGTFSGTVDFDPGPKTKSAYADLSSTYVLKLSSQGAFTSVVVFAGGYSFGNEVVVDGSNNVIVGGFYNNNTSSKVDFNPASGVTNLGGRGGYLVKLNSSGALTWAKGIDVSNASHQAGVKDMAIDSTGALYATGYIIGSADLDPSSAADVKTSNGSQDVFVAKYTSNGAYQWGESFGGAGSDWARIALDSNQNIHLAGYFQYTVDFNAGAGEALLSTNGTTNKGFLKKLRQV